jgi:hypothetical protein
MKLSDRLLVDLVTVADPCLPSWLRPSTSTELICLAEFYSLPSLVEIVTAALFDLYSMSP